MSKKAALLVYQNLNSIEEDNSYWEKYIKFHELYWDGPNASQNVFYGREYEEYRDSLSKYLEIAVDAVCAISPCPDNLKKNIPKNKKIIPLIKEKNNAAKNKKITTKME